MTTKAELVERLGALETIKNFWKTSFRMVAEKFNAEPVSDNLNLDDPGEATLYLGWVASKLDEVKTLSQDAVTARELLEAERKHSKELEATIISIINTTAACGAMNEELTPDLLNRLPRHVEEWGNLGPRRQLERVKQSLSEMTNSRDSLQRLLDAAERERDGARRVAAHDRTAELSSEVTRLECELAETHRRLEKRTSHSLILAGRLKKLTRAARIAVASLTEED